MACQECGSLYLVSHTVMMPSWLPVCPASLHVRPLSHPSISARSLDPFSDLLAVCAKRFGVKSAADQGSGLEMAGRRVTH